MWGRLTSSTIAPAASRARTASRTRASTPGSIPATKYSRGRPRRLPRRIRGRLVVGRREAEQLVRDGDRGGGGVALVATGHRVEERRRVARIAGERADLVERAGEGDDAVAADPAVGRLHADDPGQRGGLADRAAGVGPDAQRHVVGRHGRGRAAAAPAGDPVECPRVRGRAEGRVLGGRAHRELVHVRLAQDHRADLAEPLGDVGVVRGDVAVEDARPGRALAARAGSPGPSARPGSRSAGGAPRRAAGPSRRAAEIRPSAASASARARSRSIDSQAFRARFPRSAASRDAVVASRELTSPARRRAASSWARSRVRPVIAGRSPPRSVAADDRRARR